MKKLMESKKGFMESLGTFAIGVGVAAIVVVVTLLIIATVKSNAATTEGLDYTNATQCASSVICNATETAQTEIGSIPDWFGLLIIVGVAVVVLAVIKKIKS